MPALRCPVLLLSLTLAPAAAGAQARTAAASLDQRVRFGSAMSYTLGSYSEVEGGPMATVPILRHWRVDATYAEHEGNDRVMATLSYRWRLAQRLEAHTGLGGYWLPPHGFVAEPHRVGVLAGAGVERGPTHLIHALPLDAWLFLEVHAVTQRTVRVPIGFGQTGIEA
jgi:hypothetical protein